MDHKYLGFSTGIFPVFELAVFDAVLQASVISYTPAPGNFRNLWCQIWISELYGYLMLDECSQMQRLDAILIAQSRS